MNIAATEERLPQPTYVETITFFTQDLATCLNRVTEEACEAEEQVTTNRTLRNICLAIIDDIGAIQQVQNEDTATYVRMHYGITPGRDLSTLTIDNQRGDVALFSRLTPFIQTFFLNINTLLQERIDLIARILIPSLREESRNGAIERLNTIYQELRNNHLLFESVECCQNRAVCTEISRQITALNDHFLTLSGVREAILPQIEDQEDLIYV